MVSTFGFLLFQVNPGADREKTTEMVVVSAAGKNYRKGFFSKVYTFRLHGDLIFQQNPVTTTHGCMPTNQDG